MSTRNVAPERHESGARARTLVGGILMVGCVALMLFAVAAGKLLQADLKALGAEEYLSRGGVGALVLLTGWLFSLPLAMVLGTAGAALLGRAGAGRAWLLAIAGLLVLIVPVIAGSLVGEVVGPIFGAGGILIEVFLVLLLWFWAREHAALEGKMRLAAELRLGGYVSFAFVAWFLCGIGAQPIFALYPEKMVAFGMRGLALCMMYSMLAYLVIGWGLSFAAQYIATRARGAAEQ